MYRYLKIPSIHICLVLSLSGCMSAAEHQESLGSTQERTLTLGMVQQKITTGSSIVEVAEHLGSPNIVSRTQNNQETWIYDKVATEASFSQDSGGGSGGLFGFGGIGPTSPFGGSPGELQGQVSANYNKQSGAANVSQRTLTVIVKFDTNNLVQSVTYHSTKF